MWIANESGCLVQRSPVRNVWVILKTANTWRTYSTISACVTNNGFSRQLSCGRKATGITPQELALTPFDLAVVQRCSKTGFKRFGGWMRKRWPGGGADIALTVIAFRLQKKPREKHNQPSAHELLHQRQKVAFRLVGWYRYHGHGFLYSQSGVGIPELAVYEYCKGLPGIVARIDVLPLIFLWVPESKVMASSSLSQITHIMPSIMHLAKWKTDSGWDI
ncbi:hypothetical protein EDB89DRAFT_1902584 [Lactarius sanguifluus]|nr:hypothetical protein EDB89DRAFT_1902584 [Lactarius sanguifluus]